MKMLCVLLAVAFLVFQVQALPQPPPEDEGDAMEPLESDTVEEDPGLKPQPDDLARLSLVMCSGINGYCLPRGFPCHNNLVFLEKWNDCPSRHALKCCVR